MKSLKQAPICLPFNIVMNEHRYVESGAASSCPRHAGPISGLRFVLFFIQWKRKYLSFKI